MKKQLLILACAALLATSISACGSKPTGTETNAAASSSTQQQENTLTGTLDEKKDFMFVVTDQSGASYEFSFDSSAKPEGYEDVAEGDSVTVTYTGTISEVDPFDGTVISVQKN